LGPRKRGRLRVLAHELARLYPDLERLDEEIASGRVRVDGRIVTNPRSLVPPNASIVVKPERELRGEVKLRAALSAFTLGVAGRVCLDLGAAAGGFTRALLAAGAARVYAVDAGHGQLLGSLRSDTRVVNLERVNLGDLDPALVPETVEVITIDVSYLAVAEAAPQLEPLELGHEADLIALVKPMFELGLPAPPTGRHELQAAVCAAAAGLERVGWRTVKRIRSPVEGARGAIEFFVHARRATLTPSGSSARTSAPASRAGLPARTRARRRRAGRGG
jgi:23S rRNA (cytidine1920-2'-O)/16S rRNA (cytidine1409-2'-O)-methyltransferase